MGTLASFCAEGKGAGRTYIQNKVKTITCSYGGEGQRALEIHSGDINLVVDFKAYNLDEFVRAGLVEKL